MAIELKESYQNFLDNINNADLFDSAIEDLKIDNYDVDTVEQIINVVDGELLLKRRDIIHMYGCVMDYMKLVNDMMENPDNYDLTEDGTHVESILDQVNNTLSSIEDASLELDSYIEAKDFANLLLYRVKNNIEIREEASNKVNEIVNTYHNKSTLE